jgi:L-seryl-tRNA(Ser) seleniumtransferase
MAKGMELGLEARGPVVLAVIRALERYRPAHLLSEVEVGRRLTAALTDRFSSRCVSASVLGPFIKEDDVLAIALARSGRAAERPAVVPAEAAAALGMLLLQHHGILTVSALGMPGARVSLRLKATEQVIERLGGAQAVADAVVQSVDRLGSVIDQPDALRMLILGEAWER